MPSVLTRKKATSASVIKASKTWIPNDLVEFASKWSTNALGQSWTRVTRMLDALTKKMATDVNAKRTSLTFHHRQHYEAELASQVWNFDVERMDPTRNFWNLCISSKTWTQRKIVHESIKFVYRRENSKFFGIFLSQWKIKNFFEFSRQHTT